jgi:hypothetical protein
MQMDGYCPRQCDPEVLQQQRQRPLRAPSPLTFHSTPEDMVVGIAFLLRLRGPWSSWKKAVTTISHSALFSARWHWHWHGPHDIMVRRRGWRCQADQGQEREGCVGVPVGEVEEAEIVLWEE